MNAPAGNRTLSQAKRAKQDEFYTQMADIANELRHYRGHLEGKDRPLQLRRPLRVQLQLAADDGRARVGGGDEAAFRDRGPQAKKQGALKLSKRGQPS